MAITYPGTIQTFLSPSGTNTLDSPDHASLHTDYGDTIEAVQAVVGTTAGTAVLMDFTAGQFPIKQEGGALVETITGGTINATTLGTPSVTGGSFASPTTTGTDAGTATLTNKTLTSPVLQGTVDGWISANETWAYASATTITVPSGAVSKYAKGDKIKITQTTVKYFYIVGVADAVLTITGGSDYTLANATISANYYSHASSPIGFPNVFNWTPSYSGSGSLTYSSVTTYLSTFMISGKTVFFVLRTRGTTGGTTSNAILATLPVTALGANLTPIASGGGYDGSSTGVWGYYSSGYVYAEKTNGTNWGIGATKDLRIIGSYEI